MQVNTLHQVQIKSQMYMKIMEFALCHIPASSLILICCHSLYLDMWLWENINAGSKG